jgi:DNA-binding NtrC family response regulator
MSSDKLNFKHILLISSVTERSHGLARALQKYLHEPRFSYLNPDVEALPDRLFNWWDIDLMMVDLSRDKAAIYKWYSQIGHNDYMPPVIFLAHPASYSNAGSFYRAGASDYLELKGLKNAHLKRSLTLIEKLMAEQKRTVDESMPPEPQDASDNPTITSDEKLTQKSTANSDNPASKENGADFLNTGIINILSRDKLEKMSQK